MEQKMHSRENKTCMSQNLFPTNVDSTKVHL